MGGAAVSRPATDVPTVGLLTTGVLAVVDRPFYQISRPVFAFLLIKIVFLIIKLVMRG